MAGFELNLQQICQNRTGQKHFCISMIWNLQLGRWKPNQCEWMISKQCAPIFTSIWSSRTKYKIRRSRVSLNFCKRASEGSNDACLVGHFWQVIPLWWLPSPLLVNCLTQPTCFAYFDLCICHQPSLGLSEKFELLFHITNPD